MAEAEAEAEAERHTLGEAARMLRVSRHTLDKWIKRINEAEEEKAPEQQNKIEPQRHAFDYRFYTISEEELQKIREARAQMPKSAATGTFIPSYSSLAFDRRSTAGDDAETPTPLLAPLAPTPRPRAPRATSTENRSERRGRGEATGDLPDGMMSITEVERLHGIPASNIRHWTNQGIIETDPGTYRGEHGRFEINRPLTRRGLSQFYAKAVEWERARAGRAFTRCPDCPHDELRTSDNSSAEE